MAALDLVITVDTAVAHLAGAMGKPVWVLIPHEGADWRWLRHRTDSPWYPSMRLYRRRAGDSWAAVVDRVPAVGPVGAYLREQMVDELIRHHHYVREFGEDRPEIRNWRWEA